MKKLRPIVSPIKNCFFWRKQLFHKTYLPDSHEKVACSYSTEKKPAFSQQIVCVGDSHFIRTHPKCDLHINRNPERCFVAIHTHM
jgi:hypothetical protein